MYAWTGAGGVPSSSRAVAVVVVADATKERRLFVVEEKDAASSSSARFLPSLNEDTADAVDTEDGTIVAPVLPEGWNVDDNLVEVGRSRNASIGVIVLVIHSATTTAATAINTPTVHRELPRDTKEEARTDSSVRRGCDGILVGVVGISWCIIIIVNGSIDVVVVVAAALLCWLCVFRIGGNT